MWILNGTYAAALSDTGMLAPAVLVLISLGGLLRYKVSARRISINFQLRRLESAELHRSMLLYRKVHDRQAEIRKLVEAVRGDLLTRYLQRKTVARRVAEELADIEAYGKHLRSTIVRLRRRPIQRLRSWMHVCSAERAFCRSLIAYVVISGVGSIELYALQQLLAINEMQTSFALFSQWEHLRSPMLYANWIAAGFMLVTWPAVYVHRRVEIGRRHRVQLRLCKGFAVADPDRLIEQLRSEDTAEAPLQPADQFAQEETCFEILGLSPTATIEEVKEAYRERIKQTHPDRVRGMSSAFTTLAEAETKRLNAAYEEALLALQEAVPA